MTPAMLNEREELANAAPHLSFSRINRYLHCPEQYRLYYVENLRPRFAGASLVFGQIVHQALAGLFRDGSDPVQHFQNTWQQTKDYDLSYGARESWEKLNAAGQALLERFVRTELGRLANVRAAEKMFELRITSLGLPLVGFIDLVADLDGKRAVVDFKTASTGYDDHEVVLSDQLTAYQLAEPEAEQAALCVFVKTKEPQIDWLVGARSGADLVVFLEKVEYIAGEIAAGRFYKRPGKWCGWCDYLPVCTGDRRRAQET